MMISLEVLITKDDYKKLVFSSNSTRIFFAYILIVSVFIGWYRFPYEVTASGLAIAIVPPVLIIALCALYFFWKMNKRYNDYTQRTGTAYYIITENEIHIRSNNSDSTFLWGKFQKITETKDVFVLYQNAILGNIIPKRCFKSADELQQFRTLISAKGFGNNAASKHLQDS